MKIAKRCLRLMVVVLALMCAAPCFAETANYVYDNLNRLIRIVDSTNSKVMEYTYDEVGNRTHYIIKPTDLGITASSAPDSQHRVYLTCPSNYCSTFYYTTDGSTPTTNSSVYSGYITVSQSQPTTLRYIGVDSQGYQTEPMTEEYTLNIKNHTTGVSYATLQAAYAAASNGDTLRCRAVEITDNLEAGRDISVTLTGGYNDTFTSVTGSTTLIGSLKTLSGGGTVTVGNFILSP